MAYLKNGKSMQLFPTSTSTSPPPSVPLSLTPGSARYLPKLHILQVRCADGSVLDISHVKQENRALLEVKQWWVGVQEKTADGEVQFVRKEDVGARL